MNRVSVTTACLISLLLITGCAHRATPEEARASDLAARASRSAAAAATIPAAVTSRTQSACENDLRSIASKSSGKYLHTVESVEFLGDVSEYNLRNRPHAYDIVVSYTVQMAASGELVKSKETCRVNDGGSVEWMAA